LKSVERRGEGSGEDWNLARIVINQSNIIWVLGTFQQFKLVGTDEVVLALLQQWLEHLVPYLSHIFRAYLDVDIFLLLGDRLGCCLYQSPVNLIILRLKLIILQPVIFPFENNGEVSG
jgi:hypothetical protein